MAFDTKAFNNSAKKAAKSGLESLPDGEYEMETKSFAVRELQGGTTILTREAVVLGGEYDGCEIKWDLFLVVKGEEKEMAFKQLISEMTKIGFPVQDWLDADCLGEKIQFIVDAHSMNGVRFKAKKKVSGTGDKKYQNLYVEGRILTDGKPEKFTDEYLKSAAQEAIPF